MIIRYPVNALNRELSYLELKIRQDLIMFEM